MEKTSRNIKIKTNDIKGLNSILFLKQHVRILKKTLIIIIIIIIIILLLLFRIVIIIIV